MVSGDFVKPRNFPLVATQYTLSKFKSSTASATVGATETIGGAGIRGGAGPAATGEGGGIAGMITGGVEIGGTGGAGAAGELVARTVEDD
jgi:hypothetical protein